MAVRRQSRSNSISRSVDSANANSSSTESKETPPTGRVSASCPMICPSDSLTMGWNTARTSDRAMSRESSSRRSVSTPSRSTRLFSMASATACWMARSLRTMGSLWMRAWPAERRRVRRTLVGGSGLDAARAARRAGGRGGRRCERFASGQEDEEAVRAHGVQADDVLRAELARPRGARPARPRTRARRRRRRPSRASSPARPSGRGRRRRRRPRPSTRRCGARPRPPRAAPGRPVSPS